MTSQRSSDRTPAGFHAAEAAMNSGLTRNSEASNYLGWLADLCEPYLGNDVLELGAGLGDLTERFAAPGRTVHATDLSEQFVGVLRERFAGRSNVTVEQLDIVELDTQAAHDTIVMMNVLEHIEDDVATLRALRDALVDGGRLIVYVPAFMLLYSRFDREIGHYRRYRKPELQSKFEAAGLRVIDSRYVNSLAAPGWFVYCRLLGRESSDQATVSACDRIMVPLARKLEDRFHPPFGLSLFIVGERT
jgi:2-polyprenyl-3-methyl-5-hydroxy-6-metoxy-1,4-benzoquinol methylase